MFQTSYNQIKHKLLSSSIFKDSFWAVFGNGLGHFLLLLAGIVIARFLGKDVYGEYGVVKTTMFHIASFATLGLGFTATRFVAKYKDDAPLLKGSIFSSVIITIISSFVLCIILIAFSVPLANYLEEPALSMPFRFLGIIIIARALNTTTGAILAGTKNFKAVGINNIVSGVSMLATGVLFTYFWGLNGSLSALLFSQLLLCLLNFVSINKNTLSKIRHIIKQNQYSTLLRFTIPVALQELSYTISHWGVLMFLAKFCDMGEVGIYTAANQWNTVIQFIPAFLFNVVLSYLSGSETLKEQKKILKLMLLVNLLSTLIPVVLIYVFSGVITSFYGSTFVGMKDVMNIIMFSTIFDCMSKVFHSNMISEGKNWTLFVIRTIRDLTLLIVTYNILSNTSGINGAYNFAWISFSVCVGYFILMASEYILTHRDKSNVRQNSCT